MGSKPPISPFFLLSFLLVVVHYCYVRAESSSSKDVEALLSLKSDIDALGSLAWQSSSSAQLCSAGGGSGWRGVKECTPAGRVTKLVLESLNLTGTLRSATLAPLDQLRVLSFKSNSLSGPVPDLTPLANLKSLYLSDNRFSGHIPASLSALHRLKIVVMSDNRLSGGIPPSFLEIPRLYALHLQSNRLAGPVPPFDQPGLKHLNLSHNRLSGEIPNTRTLARFNASSFLDNPDLCGRQLKKKPGCSSSMAPSPSSLLEAASSPQQQHSSSNKKKNKRRIIIASAAAAGSLLIVVSICLIVIAFAQSFRSKRRKKRDNDDKVVGGGGEQEEIVQAAAAAGAMPSREGGGGGEEGGGGGGKGFSWEGEGLGKLVFCGGVGEMYRLEELLKASAETLGRGTTGSTYKAVMESGFIVTVKRLKDSGGHGHGHLGVEEFRRRMEGLGRLRNPNLVPLRAYFQAKEERLLVYDYFPNGSLFSLVHGSRPSGSGKPLHWTSCLKIAEDVATGLLYLHEANSVHGNLKSSNVLLGSDFESCLTDYGLLPALHPSEDSGTTTSSTALFYRAPECRNNPLFTPQSDIYSFGVLLLELLTGKTPYQDLVEEHGADIPRWVRSVREEETESTGDESSEEKLAVLLNIAMTCVVAQAERRPATKEVVKMIREARAEVVVSSNSSDHSPGRWSDTVQSLPREYGSEHLSFAERN